MCADCILACAFVIARVSSVRFRRRLSAGIVGFNSVKPRKSPPHCRKLFSRLEELSSAWLAGPGRVLQPWNYHFNYFKKGKNCQKPSSKYIIWEGWGSKWCIISLFFLKICLQILSSSLCECAISFFYTKHGTDSGQEWKWRKMKQTLTFCNSFLPNDGHKTINSLTHIHLFAAVSEISGMSATKLWWLVLYILCKTQIITSSLFFFLLALVV